MLDRKLFQIFNAVYQGNFHSPFTEQISHLKEAFTNHFSRKIVYNKPLRTTNNCKQLFDLLKPDFLNKDMALIFFRRLASR